jgi:hypothetical protein
MWGYSGGPGGIRTRGLFSAIEARSQLRYRPLVKVAKLYLSGIALSRRQNIIIDTSPIKL